jgi:hypothetical protein
MTGMPVSVWRRSFANEPPGRNKPVKTLNFKDSRRDGGGKETETAE